MIKLKVREKSLLYSKIKKKQTKQWQAALEQTIARLEKEIDHRKNSDLQNLPLEEQLNEKKGELERIIETRTKGAILRSKTRWHNEGEKNTKYFLNFEKRHYNQGIISQTKVKENNFVTSDKEILTECVSFYKNLYSSKIVPHNIQDTSTFFRQENDTVLRDDEREACEGLLTEKECLEGCPLSPYLFILSAEVLAKAIRKDKKIVGILVNNKEIKLSQYADDTTLTLDGSKKSLIASLEMLDDFYEVSGLRLNDTKTEAFWIGSNCGKDPIQLPGRKFKWPRYKVKALGLWFSIDPEKRRL